MAPLDSSAWLDDVSADAPAGPNVEFEPEFGALERAAQGKPGQQYGTTIIAPEDPDWRDVEAQALALLERTRDLRLLCHLAVARLHLAGLAGYAAMLATVRQLLQTRWEQVHPQLDPDDDNDPTLRANALLRLAHPGFVLKRVRDLPLAQSPRLGTYTWRDIQVANGTVEGEKGKPKPTEAVVRSAFQDSDAATVAGLRDAAVAAATEAAAVTAAFEAHAGFGTGPDFTELEKLLREVVREIERYAPAAALAAAVPAEPDVPAAAEAPAQEAAPAATATVVPAPAVMTATALTEVTTRADALHLLDVVQRYFERFEPSSPLSLMIERSRRLADMSFLDILRDMAPDGLNQAQTVTGKRDG